MLPVRIVEYSLGGGGGGGEQTWFKAQWSFMNTDG